MEILNDKLSDTPDDSRLWSSLGIVYAGLGMKEEALAAGNKALEIMNISVDAWIGFYREWDKVKILILIGNYDEAVAKLEFLLPQNGDLSIALLKNDPIWDPLREMDNFKALISNPKYQVEFED